MTPTEYAKRIALFDKYPEPHRPMVYALGLAGEAGEVCDKLKKIIRDKDAKFEDRDTALMLELGDVLWYVTRLGSYFGYALEEIMTYNYEKLLDRNNRDKIGGEGDNR